MQAATGETVSGERRASSNSLVPLDTLGGLAKASIAAGDKSLDKAEQHYKSAGLYLSEAKERVARTKNLTWPGYLIKHCPIGRRRADELISIADGRTSLAEVRAKKADSQAATMAKYRTGTSGAQSSENHQQEQQTPGPTDDDDPSADAEHKQGLRVIAARGFLNRAVEAKQICTIEKLQASDITEAMIKAADDAGAVWTATAHSLRRMISKDHPSEDEDNEEEFATKHFMFALDGVLDSAREAIECIEHVLLSEESANSLEKASDEIIAAWNEVKSVINQNRMAVRLASSRLAHAAGITDSDTIAAAKTKPAPKKLTPDKLTARQKRKADNKTYDDYSKQFGFFEGWRDYKLMAASLASGVDQLADARRKQTEANERFDREQAEYVSEETLRRATLNARLLAPITSEKEQAYTCLIKTRNLYEGACGLSWAQYFEYRDQHPECDPLTRGDLAYASHWTPCAVIPEMDKSTLTEKALRERTARIGYKVRRRGTEYNLCDESGSRIGGSLAAVINWLDTIEPTMEDMTTRAIAAWT
jgi:hypothetical protein